MEKPKAALFRNQSRRSFFLRLSAYISSSPTSPHEAASLPILAFRSQASGPECLVRVPPTVGELSHCGLPCQPPTTSISAIGDFHGEEPSIWCASSFACFSRRNSETRMVGKPGASWAFSFGPLTLRNWHGQLEGAASSFSRVAGIVVVSPEVIERVLSHGLKPDFSNS